jgi:hypothetical protein
VIYAQLLCRQQGPPAGLAWRPDGVVPVLRRGGRVRAKYVSITLHDILR